MSHEHNNESTLLHHTSCDNCGSSDANGVYDDGHRWCFACNTYTPRSDKGGEGQTSTKTISTKQTTKKGVTMNIDRFIAEYNKATFKPISDRNITLDTCKKYGVKTDETGRQWYPYVDEGNNITGFKLRGKDKNFKVLGRVTDMLFGSQLFQQKGKYITVVEGELDSLAAYQMNGSRWPNVSIANGAQSAKKAIQNNLEYLEQFDNVVINFDNDKPGQEAAQASAEVLSPNKAKTLRLTKFKDACDYLKANAQAAYASEWWNAKPFLTTGVVPFSSLWDSFVQRGTEEIIPFPETFGSLNAMMNGGIAHGEITVVGALTSVGKTTMVNEILYHLLTDTNKKIGCAFLEASMGEVVEGLLSIHSNKNIANIARENRDYSKLHNSFQELCTDEKLYVLDHNGAVDADELFAKLRAMIKGQGCEVIIIDPLQAGVTSNENSVIDTFMDKTLKLVKETNSSVIIISHMRKPAVKDPHDVSEYDMKGSGSINQIAFNTILLSRDKLAEGDVAKNSTLVKLVKCRRTGNTGEAGWLFYNQETGRVERGEKPDLIEANAIDEF